MVETLWILRFYWNLLGISQTTFPHCRVRFNAVLDNLCRNSCIHFTQVTTHGVGTKYSDVRVWRSLVRSLSTDVREPRTATGRRMLERFDAITFVMASKPSLSTFAITLHQSTIAFPVLCEEQKRAKKVTFPVAVRGSRTSVLKLPTDSLPRTFNR